MSKPFTHDNSVRIHEEAFDAWLASFLIDYGPIKGKPTKGKQPILRTQASPDQAFAKIKYLMVTQDWFPGTLNEDEKTAVLEEDEVLPMPFISYMVQDPQIDPRRSNATGKLVKKDIDPQTGQYVEYPYPLADTLAFEVTFWSAKKYSWVYFLEWLRSQLSVRAGNLELILTVEHAAPWGKVNQALRFDGSNNDSVLEGEQHRYMRHTLNFTMNMLTTLPESRRYYPALSVGDEMFGDSLYLEEQDETVPAAPNPSMWFAPPGATPAGEPSGMGVSPNLVRKAFSVMDEPAMSLVTGSARVAPYKTSVSDAMPHPNAASMYFREPNDSVSLPRVPLNGDIPFSLMSYSFTYHSSDVVTCQGVQINQNGESMAWEVPLAVAPSDRVFHRFYAVQGPILRIDYCVTSCHRRSLTVINPDLRVWSTAGSVIPQTVRAFPLRRLVWRYLSRRAYLLVVVPGSNYNFTGTYHNDLDAPTVSEPFSFRHKQTWSYVRLAEPLGSTVVLDIPDSLEPLWSFLVPYDGWNLVDTAT